MRDRDLPQSDWSTSAGAGCFDVLSFAELAQGAEFDLSHPLQGPAQLATDLLERHRVVLQAESQHHDGPLAVIEPTKQSPSACSLVLGLQPTVGHVVGVRRMGEVPPARAAHRSQTAGLCGRPEISCLLDPYNTLVFPQAVWREVRADVTQEETAWPPSV
jgi:hypothetical protein